MFPTLGGPPVAGFLSVNDFSAKRLVLALSAPGWVGPGGRNLAILIGAVAGDAMNSVFEERIVFPTLGGPPVSGFLSVNGVCAKMLVFALSAPGWLGS